MRLLTYTILACAIGLIWCAVVRAETRMVVCLKGWPCLLRHTYRPGEHEACKVDMVGEVRLFPSGTVIRCEKDLSASPRSIDVSRK